MHKFTTSLALLTVVAALATPAMAAPNDNTGSGTPPSNFCSLPKNVNNAFCLANKGGDQHKTQPGGSNDNGGNNSSQDNGKGGKWDGKGQNDNNGSGNGNDKGQHDNNGSGNNGSSQNGGGMGNWSKHDHDQFHQRFNSFNFGFFSAPSFGLRLGVIVPHSFDLRPVPRSIYKYYPQFRGYLFFATRHGDVVIVSPKSHRIIAVL